MTSWVGYIAMSLDARIADRNHGLDWLHEFGGGGDGDADYEAFCAGVDALVMGRTTHDVVSRLGEWSYAGKTSYVVTRRPLETARPDVVAVAPDFPALRHQIELAGHGCVWIVGGGQTQRAALDCGMLDRVRLFVMPVLVGEGPAVFGDGGLRRARLTDTRIWPQGIVELDYDFTDQPLVAGEHRI